LGEFLLGVGQALALVEEEQGLEKMGKTHPHPVERNHAEEEVGMASRTISELETTSTTVVGVGVELMQLVQMFVLIHLCPEEG